MFEVSNAVPDPPLGHRPQPHQGHRLQEVQLAPDIRHTGPKHPTLHSICFVLIKTSIRHTGGKYQYMKIDLPP